MFRFASPWLLLVCVAPVRGQDDERHWLSLEPGFEAAAHHLLDLDGDGREDLVVLGVDGQVAVWRGSDSGPPLSPAQEWGLRLSDPERCLVAWADVLGRGTPQLVAATPAGTTAYVIGAGRPQAVRLSRRARFAVRVDRPRPAQFVQDLNRDQLADLVLPVIGHPRQQADLYEIWIQEAAASGSDGEQAGPRFRLAASVPMEVDRETRYRVTALSDTLTSRIAIPLLSTRDVNGDGRPDLLVEDRMRRSFHLQRADGSLPPEPDVAVDLSIFRDTTPVASLQAGRTLVPSDRQQFSSRDLDGDGIPDYVISHRRKVWVFHGSSEGPQFTSPSTILKTADDITALLVVKLDDDEYPDLLMIKVVVPTLATVIAGLLGEWDVDIYAMGYTSVDGREFETVPKFKSYLAIRLPSILDILRDPQAILDRFQNVGRSFRRDVRGDFNGDGIGDVGLVSEDLSRLDVWLADKELVKKPEWQEAMIRDLVFEDPNRVWDIDRILSLLSSKAEERITRLTADRPPNAAIDLLPVESWQLEDLVAGSLTGGAEQEIVVFYRGRGDSRAARIDVLRLE